MFLSKSKCSEGNDAGETWNSSDLFGFTMSVLANADMPMIHNSLSNDFGLIH